MAQSQKHHYSTRLSLSLSQLQTVRLCSYTQNKTAQKITSPKNEKVPVLETMVSHFLMNNPACPESTKSTTD